MALGKKSIHGIGISLSAAVIALTGFLIVGPAYSDIKDSEMQIQTYRDTTTAKNTKLAQLQAGIDDLDERRQFVADFVSMTSKDKDIASASRAVSSAVIPGVSVTSFSFGNESAVSKYPVPELSISDYSVPDGFEEDQSTTTSSPSSVSESEENTTNETFRKMPISVSVSADSYDTLAKYLDALADQPRLISVISVNSSGSNSTDEDSGLTVNATIYAYAFIYPG